MAGSNAEETLHLSSIQPFPSFQVRLLRGGHVLFHLREKSMTSDREAAVELITNLVLRIAGDVALQMYTEYEQSRRPSERGTMSNELVTIRPEELKFPFELRKQVSCSLQLVNPTDHYVAFKVKTTSPKKYCVRPNTGIILPKASCDVAVTMQAQKEAPPDLQCKDKFLVQSVIVPSGTTLKDITPDTFSKEAGKIVEESKLRVVYVPPPEPPSPVPELSEEGLSPKASVLDNRSQNGSPFELAPVDLTDLKRKLSEAQMAISKLTEERNASFEQRQQLQQELALLKKSGSAKVQVGFSFLFVCVIGLLGFFVGYLFHS